MRDDSQEPSSSVYQEDLMHAEEKNLMAWSEEANKSSSTCLLVAWHDTSFFICKDHSSSSLHSHATSIHQVSQQCQCQHQHLPPFAGAGTLPYYISFLLPHLLQWGGGFFQHFRTVVFCEELLQFLIGLFLVMLYGNHIECVVCWIASYHHNVSHFNISNVPPRSPNNFDNMAWASSRVQCVSLLLDFRV